MKAERSFRKSVCIPAVILLSAIFSSFVFADSSYIVKKGDTLYSISRKYQITVAELRTANNLSESDVLKEGAKLVIPSADIRNAAALSVDQDKTSETKTEVKKETQGSETKTASSQATSKNTASGKIYEVQKGDTLYGISRKFDIRLAELLSLNNLDSNATIKVGQKLKVSVSGGTSAAQETKSSQSNNTASASTSKEQKTSSKQETSKTSEIQVAQVKTAGAVQTSTAVSWPLSNPSVKKVSGKVSGVLLTGKANEKVTAVREGTVMYTGVYRGFGEVVFVQSKTGLIYSYSGLGKVNCKKGDYVVNGTEIGTASKDDGSIKFMVFQNGMPIDPYKAPRG